MADHVERRNVPRRAEECKKAAVRLLPGSAFYEAQERMKSYLLSLDPERMLYHFRKACGLDTRGAVPLDGWESEDCQLRSHTTGHYLSALALCFHAAGDEKSKKNASYMVTELGKCQREFESSGKTEKGYLSGYREEQFNLLEKFTPYPTIWAPYYTMHKLLAGLLDCYLLLEDEAALDIAKELGLWVYRRLAKLSPAHRQKMWDMYIAGEFGGMGGVMAELYEVTGCTAYKECAALFYNHRLFDPLAKGEDRLDGMHANQHIPQVLGLLELYGTSGDDRFLKISRFFWETVTKAHCYAPGGTGESENFHGSGKISAFLTEKTMETCASYNMLKLTKKLYQYEPNAKYMDYYENVVLNHILASQDKYATGESTYFLPLKPGAVKEFLYENSCCHGTGMESQFKYREGIYYRDKETLYINLFIPSRLEEDGIFAQIEKVEGKEDSVQIFVKGRDIRFVRIRKPCWAQDDWKIEVCKSRQKITEDEAGYWEIPADYAEGENITLAVPFHFRLRRTPDEPLKAAVFFGPHMMALLSEEENFQEVPFGEEHIEEWMVPGRKPLEFMCGGNRWIPLWQVSGEPYHTYVICR